LCRPSLTAANQNLWIEAFKDEIKKYPNVKLVDTVYGYDNEQKVFDATVALTTKYPDSPASSLRRVRVCRQAARAPNR
jgi:ABC-type sugar transport system substrate-binding protein